MAARSVRYSVVRPRPKATVYVKTLGGFEPAQTLSTASIEAVEPLELVEELEAEEEAPEETTEEETETPKRSHKKKQPADEPGEGKE